MRRRVWFLGRMVLVLVVVAVAAAGVMLLWNSVAITAIAGAHPLDYLHALGLLVLCRILFGGFGGRRFGHHRAQWEKWQAMTPEERAALSQRWQGCRPGGDHERRDPATTG
ncbi:MAG TPA: hypothetical protein VMF03_04905 [Steroidobacteraceae bacterium]|nr:hypothetical protein [Steroidobacteraceae bacterium]